MNTPICDFINAYIQNGKKRFHMPGHKGVGDIEALDLTEINGLDSLYSDSGVIYESEKNASMLFGSYKTAYSVEGSSQCIKAMLHLAKMYKNPSTRGYILATRNAHSALISASFILDFDIKWLYSDNSLSYISCPVQLDKLDELLCSAKEKPFAVYITSPDYLGSTDNISEIAKICNKHNTILIVDNAHGAYLKFDEPSTHPLDLGAHMCCDSAHKTLPALTGGAYLHISKSLDPSLRDFLCENVKATMAIYGSTSPSFLILRSLDMLNAKIASGELIEKQKEVENRLDKLKKCLSVCGFELFGNERLKLTIKTCSYGYTGIELSSILESKGFFVEFFDRDFVTLMLSCNTKIEDIDALEGILCSIQKREPIWAPAPPICKPVAVMSVRDALSAKRELVHIDNALNKVLASFTLSCPPAVSIVVCGERLDKNAIEALKYYGTNQVYVVKT